MASCPKNSEGPRLGLIKDGKPVYLPPIVFPKGALEYFKSKAKKGGNKKRRKTKQKRRKTKKKRRKTKQKKTKKKSKKR